MTPYVHTKWAKGYPQPVHTVGIDGTSIRLFMSPDELRLLITLAKHELGD